MDEARTVKDPGRLAFWADCVRAFTETKTLTREVVTSSVIRRSKLWRRFYFDDHEPTAHVEHLRAATPARGHEWQRVDPLVPDEDRWPAFRALSQACGDDTFAVIDMPYRRVAQNSDWEWANDDLEIMEFPVEATWDDAVEASREAEIFGPFFTIDRMMVTGSSGLWCLVYTEVPEVECWVATADSTPPIARDLLTSM